jgi:hypothetical protein
MITIILNSGGKGNAPFAALPGAIVWASGDAAITNRAKNSANDLE